MYVSRTVSAPVVLKRDRIIKSKTNDKNGSFQFSSSLNSGMVFNQKDNEQTLTHQWTRIVSQELQSKTSPMKGLLKSPPRHMAIEEDTEQLYVNDLEANPEFLSPPKITPPTKDNITPPNRKIKKLSPTKAASAPQKSYSNTLTGSNASNSAPVYRLGSQEPIIDEDLPPISRVIELSSLPNPEAALRKALEGLGKGTEEWEEKIDALLLLRRLSACHTNVILPQLHTVLYAVEKEVS